MPSPGSRCPSCGAAFCRSNFPRSETLVGWFQPDLDSRLHFAAGLIALTDRRLLAWTDRSSSSLAHSPLASSNGQADDWQSWPLREELELRLSEQSGIGKLELINPTSRLACWRYTPRGQRRRASLRGQLDGVSLARHGLAGRRSGARAHGLPQLRRSDHRRRRRLPGVRAGGAAAARLVAVATARVREIPRRHDGPGTRAHHRRQFHRVDARLPYRPVDRQRAGPVAGRPADPRAFRVFLLGVDDWRGTYRVATELGAAVRHLLGQRVHRLRPARADLRTSAKPVAGILRRQTHRRSDVAHR